MGRPSRYSPEVRERAVRLVFEHEDQHDSQWAASCAVPTRSCGRRRRISHRRNSTAERSDSHVHRSAPPGLWGGVDLRRLADRPADVKLTVTPRIPVES